MTSVTLRGPSLGPSSSYLSLKMISFVWQGGRDDRVQIRRVCTKFVSTVSFVKFLSVVDLRLVINMIRYIFLSKVGV